MNKAFTLIELIFAIILITLVLLILIFTFNPKKTSKIFHSTSYQTEVNRG